MNDTELSAIKLGDDVYEVDRADFKGTPGLLFDDLKFLKEDIKDINPLNKEQKEQLLSSNEKEKTIQKSDYLQSLINKICQQKLTKHVIIMLILNILMALTLIIVFLFLKRTPKIISIPVEEILIMKRGNIFGGPGGEQLSNDGETAMLTFNDNITRVSGAQSRDLTGHSLLLFLTITYSNGKTGKPHGGINPIGGVESISPLELDPEEYIDEIIVYEDYRRLDNPYRDGKLTYLITGIHLKTNLDRKQMFGSRSGKNKTESFPGYYLAYIQGKDGGFIDSIRFTWYKYCLKNSLIIK